MDEQRPTKPRWPRFKRHAPRWLRYWFARGKMHSLRGRFRRWLYEYELWQHEEQITVHQGNAWR